MGLAVLSRSPRLVGNGLYVVHREATLAHRFGESPS